ncbi:cytochrome P450 [Peristeroidobacter soli]|uniref:cytochrome P450 n=1 Tax=Peristeroidobacter soli TaxID=2497877 RepID=UPI00101D9D92|nr:cytochrome P450 [Peristeroidobacter soli]
MSTITVTGYKEAQQTLSIPDLSQALYDEGAALMADVLVNLHGEDHKQRRALEMSVFRRDFFSYYEKEVLPPVVEETLRPFVAAGRGDVVEIGYRAMIGLTADFAGIDRQRRVPEETADLVRLLRVFGHAATMGQFKGTPSEAEELKKRVVDGMREFDERFFGPSVARREALLAKFRNGEIDEAALPRDILTLLLRNELNLDLPRERVLRETAFYFLAGAHTSIHSLSHAMHEIFALCERNPAERERLEKDVLFLQRCVHESFRLHPSSPVSKRKAMCPMSLPNGQAATTTDTIVIDLYQANRQVDAFGDDAASFNPHRTRVPPRMPYGITFGVGVHSCLGKNLAAGDLPTATTNPETHQLGTVTLLARAFLAHGARPDPTRKAEQDLSTERETWLAYPLVFAR